MKKYIMQVRIHLLCAILTPLFLNTLFTSSLQAQTTQTLRSSTTSKDEQLRSMANQNTVTLVSEGSSDAQVQFANDLADILNDSNDSEQLLRVLPVVGAGGSQNALDILYLRGVDMGILQTDTLAYLRGRDPVAYANIHKRIHYIAKLYNAEWHVIARKDIKNLKDLKGKKVNISRQGSGTFIASKTILELLDINVEYTNYSDNVALEKLQAGEIAAMTILAGAPVTFLKSINPYSNLHLVPVTFFFEDPLKVPYKNILEHFYLPTQLKKDDYPNLITEGETIPSVASGIILAAYNWPSDSERNRKVERFVKEFFAKFDSFHQPGRHPKWREVNLSAKVSRWTRLPAAEREITQTKESDISRSENVDTFMNANGQKYKNKDFSQLTDQQRQELYQDFMRWQKTKQ